jgi:hypothetical protein
VKHAVGVHDPVCVDEMGDDVPLCGRPATLLHAADGEVSEVLFAASADDWLYRVAGVSESGALDWDSRSIGTFGLLSRLLPCDLDGQGPPEVLYSSNDSVDPGFLLWDGELSEDATRSGLIPPGPLWKATCVDVDADGAADLVGIADDGDLVIHRGGPQGFDPSARVVPLDIAAVGGFTEADATRMEGCPTFLLAVLSYDLDDGGQPTGVDSIIVLSIDPEHSQVVGESALPLDALERPVLGIRFLPSEEGRHLLAVTTRDRDDSDPAAFSGETLELFATDGCGPAFDSVGALSFSQVRRLHPRLGVPSQVLVVGNEIDGVVLVETLADGPPVVARTWDVSAIDAEIVALDGTEPALAVSYASEPYLALLPLAEGRAGR